MKKIPLELPMDIVTEVLIRLPVQSLARFKCVCKEWSSVISSPDFVSLHYTHLHNDQDDDPFLLTLSISERKTQGMLRSGLTFKKVRDYRIPIPTNLEDLNNYEICGGSADGLVLIMTKTIPLEIMLWNPLLGKTRKLPPICCNEPVFGLGFDSARRDYKVVAITPKPHVSVQIYYLRAHTWRTITNYEETIISKLDSHGVLMEGTIHWVIDRPFSNDCHMVLFDVKNEVFNYIRHPEALKIYYSWKYPVMYRGKLGLLLVFPGLLCRISVTEKDLEPGAWFPLYEVDLGKQFKEPYFYRDPYYYRFRVLNFKKNGQLIFATTRGVKLYDFESNQMKQLLKTSPRNMTYSSPYKESLFLI